MLVTRSLLPAPRFSKISGDRDIVSGAKRASLISFALINVHNLRNHKNMNLFDEFSRKEGPPEALSCSVNAKYKAADITRIRPLM